MQFLSYIQAVLALFLVTIFGSAFGWTVGAVNYWIFGANLETGVQQITGTTLTLPDYTMSAGFLATLVIFAIGVAKNVGKETGE